MHILKNSDDYVESFTVCTTEYIMFIHRIRYMFFLHIHAGRRTNVKLFICGLNF